MKRTLNTAALAALALLLVACPKSPQVTSDYNPRTSTGTAEWRTYAWMPHPSGEDQRMDPVIAGRIKLAVEKALNDRGYKQAFGQKPDFLVGYHAAAQTRILGLGPRRNWVFYNGKEQIVRRNHSQLNADLLTRFNRIDRLAFTGLRIA